MPPSRYLALDVKPWGETDFLLTQALELHDRMLCPGGCGQYADEAHDDDNEGGYEVVTVLCHACAAREEWHKDHSGDEKPGPGTQTAVVKRQRASRRPAGAARPR